MERTGSKPLDAIFAETHEVKVEDGVMDAAVRQKVLRALGFCCVKFDYVQPPLSASHQPCGGLRLLVKDQTQVPSAVVVAYLDGFAGSVLDYDNSWKSEEYYCKQINALSQSSVVETTNELPW